MKFNYKNRGFVVITLSAMLVVVGVANYQLSKKSALGVSNAERGFWGNGDPYKNSRKVQGNCALQSQGRR